MWISGEFSELSLERDAGQTWRIALSFGERLFLTSERSIRHANIRAKRTQPGLSFSASLLISPSFSSLGSSGDFSFFSLQLVFVVVLLRFFFCDYGRCELRKIDSETCYERNACGSVYEPIHLFRFFSKLRCSTGELSTKRRFGSPGVAHAKTARILFLKMSELCPKY